ncbi:hypothetical protein A2U01_0049571, partial [Trifolium medium]|nr:hypothetical protein [Trifolium medium]
MVGKFSTVHSQLFPTFFIAAAPLLMVATF